MRARWVLVGVAVAGLGSAAAEPKPTKVDIKSFRDELVVLQDNDGGTYVVKPYKLATGSTPTIEARIWFGTAGKELYEQVNTGRSAEGQWWSQTTWAPRVSGFRGAMVQFKDNSYQAWCDKDPRQLTQLTGDKAKVVLDRSSFMTELNLRRSHMLARDDAGIYYYVDKLSAKHGGKGYRVFVGRKGTMKQLALTDVASDTAGEVFSTKTGDLRLTRSNTAAGGSAVVWIKGEKRLDLTPLDPEFNAPVVWTELGVYKFLGTLCDNM